jgi:predicted RecB family nuclease
MEGVPTPEEISALETRPWWVDMHTAVKNFHWPLRKLGLKDVAKCAGMEWDASDAGGANSMLWYRAACDPSHPDAAAMAEKLVRYNTDDVRATWILRRWLNDGIEGRGWSIRPVESLGPPSSN